MSRWRLQVCLELRMRGSVFFACCNLQVSLEPSLESGKPGSKQGQSAVLSIVREKPHELQVGGWVWV
jgi:hypothetical protein